LQFEQVKLGILNTQPVYVGQSILNIQQSLPTLQVVQPPPALPTLPDKFNEQCQQRDQPRVLSGLSQNPL